MARKLIIDTDPGVDDAMAIFYALNSPEFDVIGITTIFGNASTAITTRNALRLLEIAERLDIPVAAGAEHALTMPPREGGEFVHGADGQGNTHLPPSAMQAVDQHAAQFLSDAIRQFPGEITIVALGPLTNLALMFLMQPDIAPLIHEIVLMGGNAFVPGNVNPAAEANIFSDPEAADLVFGTACPITMVGLDVTMKIYLTTEHFDQIASFENAKARHITRIVPHYRAFYSSRLGRDAIPIHDSTTISYLLKPSLFKVVRYGIRVETSGISRGKTWPGLSVNQFTGAWANRPLINICVEAAADECVRMELERLGR